MKKITNFLKNSFDKQIDGIGLAVFRIAYSLVLLCEIVQMYYFKELIFDKTPFLDKAEISFAIPIVLWSVSVLMILFGFFTRFAAIINYILSLILIGSITTFEYHVFYAYMSVNFLFIFLPISKCLSLDRLLLKLKYSNTTFQYNPSHKVSQLYYFIIPFIGLSLVYFDSTFYKLSSVMWLNGLGSWLPSSLPMISHANTSTILNNEVLIKTIGWLTILFEFIFSFVFFRKKWRIFIIITGLILHFGILLHFPIPWFALTAISIYILLVPVSFWKKLFTVKKKEPNFYFYYDTECPLCVRTKITITHLDWFNKIGFKTVQFDAQDHPKLVNINKEDLLDNIYSVDKKGNVYSGVDTYMQVFKRIFYLIPLYLLLKIPGVYHIAKIVYGFVAENRDTERCTEENCGYNPPIIIDTNEIKILENLKIIDLKKALIINFIFFSAICQVGIIYRSWLVNDVKELVHFRDTKVDKLLSGIVHKYSTVTKTFLGLTNHAVFSDEIHFDNYNHIIAIVYENKNKEEVWLPIINKNGQPDLYIYGANWVNWTFRTNQLDIDIKKLEKGIERYTSFWMGKNGIDFKKAKFKIKVKKIESTQKWEKDFLNKQIAKPWIDGGFIEWNQEKFYSSIKDIESL